MVFLYGHAGRSTAQNGGFGPGQYQSMASEYHSEPGPDHWTLQKQLAQNVPPVRKILTKICVWTYRDRSLENE